MLLSPAQVAGGCRRADFRSLAGRRPSISRWSLGALCTATLLAAGCNGKPASNRVPVYPVEAKITYKGFPAAGAFVTFHAKSPRPDVPAPRAEVNKDGVVKISTYDGGDGAPEGEYVVTVEWHKLVKQGADLVQGPNVIPLKYGRPQTSDIVRKINAGPNKLEPITL
jgi:hypothetical protein